MHRAVTKALWVEGGDEKWGQEGLGMKGALDERL